VEKSSGAKKRAAIARLRDEVRELGRRIRMTTQQQMRIAERYGNDAALEHNKQYRRLIEHKAALGRKYLAVSKRYQRLRDE
jgi:hypothetical protein